MIGARKPGMVAIVFVMPINTPCEDARTSTGMTGMTDRHDV